MGQDGGVRRKSQNVPAQVERTFEELRRLGYHATCGEFHCPGCGMNHLENEGCTERYVFYTQEGAETLQRESTTELYWNGKGGEIFDVLHRHRLAPAWNGRKSGTMKIRWSMRH